MPVPLSDREQWCTKVTLPPPVANLFRESMVLSPVWRTFEDALATAPRTPGIYALGFPRGVHYDGGVSCVAYIGSAADLKQRISTHFRNDHNYNITQLRQAYGQLTVAWWLLPEFDKDWRLTAEGEAICRFERQFGSVPICNLAVQHTPHAKLLRDLISISECRVEYPIVLDEFKQLGFRIRPTFRPGLDKTRITANQWFYEGVEWPTEEQVAEVTRKREIEDLSWVGDEVVTTWSAAKMKSLVTIGQSLIQDERPSTVIRFLSSRREVPRPHTWGEVAVVLGRMSAGSWYPQNRTWVKILCGKELLGQAILESHFFRGEDKSDLPQRSKLPKRAVPDIAVIESRFQAAISMR